METFEFHLPICRNDLLRRSTANQYVVELIGFRHLPGALENFRVTMRTEGYLTILEQFNVPFSILCSDAESSQALRENVWQVLLKGMSSFVRGLRCLVEKFPIPNNSRLQHLNALKMICYLMSQLSDNFEAEESKVNMIQGRKKKSADAFQTIDWPYEKEAFLKVLLELVVLDLDKLWDPPIAEENFINLIISCCYNLLQNPSITRQKETKEVIGNILGVLVKRHNRALCNSLRILQLLQRHEHTISSLVQITEIIVTKYGATNIVFEIMREIGRLDSKEISNNSSGTKAYATFLVDLSAKIPQAVFQNISVLMPCLEMDSSIMRNCILCVIKEIIVNVLSSENLEASLKKTKDQFFTILKDHVHDVHAFVRSKVLQIWLEIVQQQCLPLSHQEELTGLVVGRLNDKAANVRRYSIQLLTALLQMNPFAHKLQYEDLIESYRQEKEKLDKMLEENSSSEDPDLVLMKEKWSSHENAMMEVFEELSSVSPDDYEDIIGDDDTSDRIMNTIVSTIDEKDYNKSRLYLLAANTIWPDVFVLDLPQSDDSKETKDESDVPVEVVVKGLKDVYLGKHLVLGVPKAAVNPIQSSEVEVNDLSKQQVLVLYLKDSLTFSGQVKEAIPILCQMLHSKVNSDILEAIEFFVTSFAFGMPHSLVGIRKVLLLLNSSKDSTIKEAAVNAYKKIYLNLDAENERSKALKVVDNLTTLMKNISLEELISLDAVIANFMKSGDLHISVIQVLWERFALKIPRTTPDESRTALNLLMMAAGGDSKIIKSNIAVLVSEGLGPRAEKDFRIAKDTCLALMKIGSAKKQIGMAAPPPYRLDRDHELFTRLQDLLLTGLFDLENEFWVPLCDKAVCTIYTLSESPDHKCEQLVKAVAEKVLSLKIESDSDSSSNCQTGVLVRFVFLIGCIAHRQLEHMNRDLLTEMKRRNALLEKSKLKKKSRKNPDVTSTTASSTLIEEELGLTGASAEDDEYECIRKVCETEILSGETLLAIVAPLIVNLCRNQSKFSNPELRTAASLTLSKLMLISSEFCENNLQLLFTILEKSSLPSIRANTIIALGDLASLFPNLIEPWTAHMYARLRDPSPLVRRNTVSVLSHLILNDMVKIKGQISEMAVCIIDEDEKIKGLAKVFFVELSGKANAIYNIIADIISRLSDPEIGVEKASFQTILKFLFSFVQKGKQTENLAEKLCQRFRVTSTERQWNDLAFCLSLLTFNEKCVHKLQDNFNCYSDKLANDELYEHMLSILKKARTRCKIEFKTTIDEIEAQITQCHTKGLDEAIAEKGFVFKTPAKAPAKSKKRSSSVSLKTPKQTKGVSSEHRVTPRKSQRKKNKASYFSSDSDEENPPSDDSDDFIPSSKTPIKRTRSARKRALTPIN
ncbi:condensin complex subunit 1-like [Octopus sinensis]|uniref:Condensin complex subunit 1 n=1 Tax=Octopus sinensis TaxID=2607531 RepID=A0A6P7TNR7_9MOLL|nr:condensin complex subunit 1-like [Octopus sinensis]